MHWDDPEYVGTPEGTQLTRPSALDPVVDIINERNLTVLHAVRATTQRREALSIIVGARPRGSRSCTLLPLITPHSLRHDSPTRWEW